MIKNYPVRRSNEDLARYNFGKELEKNHRRLTFGKKREVLEKIKNLSCEAISGRSRKIRIWKRVGEKP